MNAQSSALCKRARSIFLTRGRRQEKQTRAEVSRDYKKYEGESWMMHCSVCYFFRDLFFFSFLEFCLTSLQ